MNQFATQAHKYCVKNSGYNLSSASLSKDEEVAFGNCLKLYAQSFQLFNKEKSVFNRGLEEIAAKGGDKFAHLNYWAREKLCVPTEQQNHDI